MGIYLFMFFSNDMIELQDILESENIQMQSGIHWPRPGHLRILSH